MLRFWNVFGPDYLMECQVADIAIPYYKQTNNQLQ